MIDYIENPEKTEFPEFDRVFKRYKDIGKLKPDIQMNMYRAIANKWCVGKSVIDAGCGIGIGTNILGREALGVYGVDNNKDNVEVAKQLYEGPRIKFDVYDLVNPPERPVATFDVVVCIEVIEHVKDYDRALQSLKKFYDLKRRTIFFISSPNRNHPSLNKDKPDNEYHVREWSAGEFYEVLTKHFKSVVLYSGELLSTFGMEETVDGATDKSPVIAKCELPI